MIELSQSPLNALAPGIPNVRHLDKMGERMIKMIPAKIQWYSAENGGRKRPLDIGIKYYPLIILDDDETNTPWSVHFITTPTETDGWCRIRFSMLVDNEATRSVESKLVPGTRFHFYEGQAVARGIVVQG